MKAGDKCDLLKHEGARIQDLVCIGNWSYSIIVKFLLQSVY